MTELKDLEKVFCLQQNVVQPSALKVDRACSDCQKKRKEYCHCGLASRILKYDSSDFSMPSLSSKIFDDLNDAKAQLSDMPFDAWSQHTNSTFLAGSLKKVVSEVLADVSLSAEEGEKDEGTTAAPEILNYSFLKLYEILHKFNLFNIREYQPSQESSQPPAYSSNFNSQSSLPPLLSCHLCECPGGFISATNAYLKAVGSAAGKEVHWTWRGVSLDPFHELNDFHVALDAYGLAVETRHNWLGGANGTGDITRLQNVQKIAKEFEKYRCDLVTADGSYDVQFDPGLQEIRLFPLLFSEVYCALNILKPGGSFVCKSYIATTPNSACLLALICQTFSDVNLVKPFASKPGNSEVYIVAKNYLGLSSSLASSLGKVIGADVVMAKKTLFPRPGLSSAVVSSVVSASEYFCSEQLDAIRKNIETFRTRKYPPPSLKIKLSHQWMHEMYLLRPLRARERLVPTPLKFHESESSELATGTQRDHLDWGEDRTAHFEDWNELIKKRTAYFATVPPSDCVKINFPDESCLASFDGTVEYRHHASATGDYKKVHSVFSFDLFENVGTSTESFKKFLSDALLEQAYSKQSKNKQIRLSAAASSDTPTQTEPTGTQKWERFGDWIETGPWLKPFKVSSSPFFDKNVFVSLLFTTFDHENERRSQSYSEISRLWIHHLQTSSSSLWKQQQLPTDKFASPSSPDRQISSSRVKIWDPLLMEYALILSAIFSYSNFQPSIFLELSTRGWVTASRVSRSLFKSLSFRTGSGLDEAETVEVQPSWAAIVACLGVSGTCISLARQKTPTPTKAYTHPYTKATVAAAVGDDILKCDDLLKRVADLISVSQTNKPNLFFIDLLSISLEQPGWHPKREPFQLEIEIQNKLLSSLYVSLSLSTSKAIFIITIPSFSSRLIGSLMICLSYCFESIRIFRSVVNAQWTQFNYVVCSRLIKSGQTGPAHEVRRLLRCALTQRSTPDIQIQTLLPPIFFTALPAIRLLRLLNQNLAGALERGLTLGNEWYRFILDLFKRTEGKTLSAIEQRSVIRIREMWFNIQSAQNETERIEQSENVDMEIEESVSTETMMETITMKLLLRAVFVSEYFESHLQIKRLCSGEGFSSPGHWVGSFDVGNSRDVIHKLFERDVGLFYSLDEPDTAESVISLRVPSVQLHPDFTTWGFDLAAKLINQSRHPKVVKKIEFQNLIAEIMSAGNPSSTTQ